MARTACQRGGNEAIIEASARQAHFRRKSEKHNLRSGEVEIRFRSSSTQAKCHCAAPRQLFACWFEGQEPLPEPLLERERRWEGPTSIRQTSCSTPLVRAQEREAAFCA